MSRMIISLITVVLSIAPLSWADYLGWIRVLGTNWGDLQHNSTIGRMVERDQYGYIQAAWMSYLDQGLVNRHVLYNCVDLLGNPGSPCQIDWGQRSGYITLSVYDQGNCVVAYHSTEFGQGGESHTGIAADFQPHSGAFLNSPSPWIGTPLLWPQIAYNGSTSFFLAAEAIQPESLNYNVLYHCRFDYDGATNIVWGNWEEAAPNWGPFFHIAASLVSDRVAIAWGHPISDSIIYGLDLHVSIAEDGLNWGEPINITEMIPPDSSLLPDTTLANRDTLRIVSDCFIYFDQDDYLHAIFPTAYFSYFDGWWDVERTIIWHWSEQFPDDFFVVADGWWMNPHLPIGVSNAHLPSLAQDPYTGYFYCIYQTYAPYDTSAAGISAGEIYATVSTDGGQSWALPTNLTNTQNPGGGSGQCFNEIQPSLSPITVDSLDLLFTLDKDAGSLPNTINEILLQTVLIDCVATTPLLVTNYQFHVDPVSVVRQPATYSAIYQTALVLNPNPTNEAITIRYDLAQTAQIELSVWNIKGEQTAILHRALEVAGPHNLRWSPETLSSGIYFVKLSLPTECIIRKAVFIK